MAVEDKNLLPGWEAFQTDEGEWYYYHEGREETTWDKPEAPKAAPKPAPRAAAPTAPAVRSAAPVAAVRHVIDQPGSLLLRGVPRTTSTSPAAKCRAQFSLDNNSASVAFAVWCVRWFNAESRRGRRCLNDVRTVAT